MYKLISALYRTWLFFYWSGCILRKWTF